MMEDGDRGFGTVVNIEHPLSEFLKRVRLAVDTVIRVRCYPHNLHVAFGASLEDDAARRCCRDPDVTKRELVGLGNRCEFGRCGQADAEQCGDKDVFDSHEMYLCPWVLAHQLKGRQFRADNIKSL